MSNLRAQTLARAASILGGAEVLAVELDVPSETLARYISGESAVPTKIFLRATEIVTDASVADAARASLPEQPPPR